MLDENSKPEDVFTMLTVMPKKGIKVTAHLEDPDGDKVTIADISESLVPYIIEEMSNIELTSVNSQMFPLAASLCTSVVPRFVGIPIASIFFAGSAFRESLITLSLASMLFWQYIQQHNLKIVTEVTPLDEAELERINNQQEANNNRFREQFKDFIGDDNAEPEEV